MCVFDVHVFCVYMCMKRVLNNWWIVGVFALCAHWCCVVFVFFMNVMCLDY